MSDARERLEKAGVFQAVVGEEGTIAVPVSVLEGLGIRPGSRVQVRVSPAQEVARMRRRGIPEEEVERIALLQGEDRGHVVRFLLSEGALAGRRTVRRRR
jgi:bifunctional DNA-binding transcriptional regulator/antitoxin component of YhaV-PrlF toxin-antitoxin module